MAYPPSAPNTQLSVDGVRVLWHIEHGLVDPALVVEHWLFAARAGIGFLKTYGGFSDRG